MFERDAYRAADCQRRLAALLEDFVANLASESQEPVTGCEG